jgi:AcrR family transcriptional regulator
MSWRVLLVGRDGAPGFKTVCHAGFECKRVTWRVVSARGPYAKGVAKRREILDAALRVIAEHGYSGATVKQIADAVGLSQNGLLHYFGSKDALFVEVLRRRDELDALRYGGVDAEKVAGDGAPVSRAPADFEGLRDGIGALVRHNAEVAGLVHLFSRLAAEASEPSHPAHRFFADRYADLRRSGEEWLGSLQSRGLVRTDVSPQQATVMLFALIDGLQNQWMYDDSVDMGAHIEAFADLLRPPA